MIRLPAQGSSRVRWAAALLLLAGAACSGEKGASDEVAPVPVTPTATTSSDASEIDLDVPPTCDDVGAENDWDDTLCETGGNGACQGQGVATSDCEHCCEAAPPSCADVAKAEGWSSWACEAVDDDACYGLGVASSDCDVCCEAPSSPPTCADVASDWGFDQPTCEANGNGACGGDGPETADCDHCCDGADVDPEDAPPPPPPPSITCGMLATSSGWPNPVCEYDGNGACQGQGPQTVDCDHCCSGTGAMPPPSGCGNGTCDGGETCATCPTDCGTCMRAVEWDLDGVGDKKRLYRAMKILKHQKPAVVGLEGVDQHQVKFLAKRLGLGGHRFAPTKHVGKGKVGVGLLSSYSLRHFHAKRLPGKKDVLAHAFVRTPLGEFPFGVTWLDDASAKAAASKAKHVLGDGFSMLAVDIGGAEFGPAHKVLETGLVDGWDHAWGSGHTTNGARVDFLFHGKSWEPAISGGVVGTKGASQHAPIVEDYPLVKMGRYCDAPSTLHDAGDLADRVIGTASGASALDVPDYQKVLAREFDLVTTNAYFGELEPQRGTFGYCLQDKVYDFSRHNGKRVRIHPLVWAPPMSEYHAHEAKKPGSESWNAPPWLIGIADSELPGALKNHIQHVIQHYEAKGGVDEWVVVNEAVEPTQPSGYRDNVYFEKMGAGYIAQSFRWARQFDPKAELIYNDYDCEGSGQKSDMVFDMIEKLAADGVPIDAVGFQTHVVPSNFASSLSPQALRDNIRRYATIRHKNGRVGVRVIITELDIQDVHHDLTAAMRRKIYSEIVGVCATEPNCQSITVWGFTDGEAFDSAGGSMLFHTPDQVRPSAYGGVMDGLLGAVKDECIGWRPGPPPPASFVPSAGPCGG